MKRPNEYAGSHTFSGNDTWIPRQIVSPWPRKNFFHQSRAPLNPMLSHDAQGGRWQGEGEGTERPGGVDRIPMSAGIYCTFREKRRKGLQRKYKGERTYACGSTMKDECEYVSGIESTGGSSAAPVNFNFLFLLSYAGRTVNSPVVAREKLQRTQMEIKDREIVGTLYKWPRTTLENLIEENFKRDPSRCSAAVRYDSLNNRPTARYTVRKLNLFTTDY